MIDQGSGAEIMYPDLYIELNLKPKDLIAYDSPLMSFDGNFVILRGQIRLPVQVDSEVVEVDFIMVDAYSLYTAIMTRPWLHALGAVSSTLHLKVKYPSEDHFDAVKDEVMKLKQAGAIKEIFYPEWLANIVVVKKKSGK